MAEDLVREYRREREILLRKLEATVKTIIVTLVLAGGVAAIWAQSPPIKWPEQVERSKWPVFYQGAIEQTATICVDVAPKLSPAETRALYSSANYELAFQPATQFRLVVDGEQRYISFGRITGSNSSFSFKPGRHSIEIAVREPASSVRLSMMLRTMDEGDQPDAIHLCSAAASGDPLIAPPDVALPKASLKKFTPPEAVLNNLNPKLAMEPTIIAPPDVNLPNVNMAQYGDPFAKIGPASNGPGSGGGIGGSAHGPTQVGRDQWPDYAEPLDKSQWPVFYSGRVEKSTVICIEVDPKGGPDLAPPFNVLYSLAVAPAAQFRMIVDEEEKLPPSRPSTSAVGTFGLQRGTHTVEVVVRQPVETVRLAMIIQTGDGSHIPDGIRLCGAQEAPPLWPKWGGNVSAPVPIYKPEPEYTKQALKAKLQGNVMLAVVVDVDGKAKNIQVVRSLGMGLDEKAVEAVATWMFKPGVKDGVPVPVKANIDVHFRMR
jgi:TonB family protein